MDSLITTSIEHIYSSFSNFFSMIIAAVIILLVGIILGKVAGRLVHRVLKEVELDVIISRTTGIKASVSEMIGKILSYVIYFIFIIAALEKLNISSVAFNLLAGGIMIIIIISVFLGIKDFIPNMIAGIYLAQKKMISVGDKVKVDSTEGEVLETKLTMTKLKIKSGDILFIPNSNLVKSRITKKKIR